MILTITSERNNGKGKEDILKFDKKIYVHELLDSKLLNSFNFTKFTILICDFNEDAIRSTGTAKKYFKTIDNMISFYEKICDKAMKSNPNLKIYQDPKKCYWINNKAKTYENLNNIILKTDIFSIPKIYIINSSNDIDKITHYPIIMKTKVNSGKERKLDCIVKTAKEAKQKFNENFKIYKEIIGVQKINSSIPKLNYNHVIRFYIVNDLLIDWSTRPSKTWNIHAKNCTIEKIEQAEKYISPIIQENKKQIECFIKKMYSFLGNGFFAWDVIYCRITNKFYICELGLKYFDYFIANRMKNKSDRLFLNKKKLKNFYITKLKE